MNKIKEKFVEFAICLTISMIVGSIWLFIAVSFLDSPEWFTKFGFLCAIWKSCHYCMDCFDEVDDE